MNMFEGLLKDFQEKKKILSVEELHEFTTSALESASLHYRASVTANQALVDIFRSKEHQETTVDQAWEILAASLRVSADRLRQMSTDQSQLEDLVHSFKIVTGQEPRDHLHLLEDLGFDEYNVFNVEYNHKVKLPQFIINTMYGYDNLHDMLTEEYFNDSTEEIDSDDVQCWIGENFDKLCYAWLHQNSYEVEEEPKYYVCVPYAGSYYWKTGSLINPIGTATGNNKWTLKNCEFTQKEIDELLPDVEKFKIPVEEVNHVSDR